MSCAFGFFKNLLSFKFDSWQDQCNRDRCLTEPKVHKSTELPWHVVLLHLSASANVFDNADAADAEAL